MTSTTASMSFSRSEFRGTQWMLADMAIQTEAARRRVYKSAALIGQGVSGRALAPSVTMAKCYASDAAMRVATDARPLWGSSRISKDNSIERYFRDAKVLRIVAGTNQIQRNIIGRHVVRTTDVVR